MAPNCTQSKSKGKPLSKSKRRASRRLIAQLIREKRMLNRDRDVASCATRTVELPSTSNIGEEKHKLLFMLSLGFIPNYKKSVEPTAYVSMQKLDHEIYLEVQAKTEERIKKILEQRLLDEIFQPRKQISVPDPRGLKLVPLKLIPEDEFEQKAEPISPEDVELIDLSSDDDDNFSSAASCSYSSPEPGEIIVDLASSDDEDIIYEDDNRLTARNAKRVTFDSTWELPSNLPKQTKQRHFTVFPTLPASGTASPVILQEFQSYQDTMNFVNFHTARRAGPASKKKWNLPRRTSPRVSQMMAARVAEESMLDWEQLPLDYTVDCTVISGKHSQMNNTKSQNTEQCYEVEDFVGNDTTSCCGNQYQDFDPSNAVIILD